MTDSVSRSSDKAEFDAFATNYDIALSEGLSVSGEDKDFFAKGRVDWLSGRLAELGEKPRRLMDFGCGTGSAAEFLLGTPGAETLVGIDSSSESLKVGRQRYGSENVTFSLFGEYKPREEIDLAYCNGVFHHIPVAERSNAVKFIWRSLRPGGLFAFWENNPLNPGTRYVMSRIPFDRDAITLTSGTARKLVRDNGFSVLRTDFLFIFPKMLSWLRGLEPPLSRMPFGAQYQVLCRKDSN